MNRHWPLLLPILLSLMSTSKIILAQRPELVVQVGHASLVNAVAFSPDGKVLASASQDSTVILWDVATGRNLRSLVGHTKFVISVAFSPDGKVLASGSNDDTVILWDVITGQKLRTLAERASYVAFSPAGRSFVSWGSGAMTTVWDMANGQQLYKLGGNSFPLSVVFSPDGKVLAIGNYDSTVLLWDAATGRQLRALSDPGYVTSLAFSPDGKLFATVANYTAMLWDAATGRKLRSLPGYFDNFDHIAFSPDGKSVASRAALWDVTTGQKLFSLAEQHATSIVFSPDGKLLASSYYVTVTLWDATTGREVRTLTGDLSYIYAIAFSPDGRLFASGGIAKTITLWDTVTGQKLSSLAELNDVSAIAFSPDGTLLASANGLNVTLWDVATGQQLRSLIGDYKVAYRIYSLAFSPDGKLLAGGCGDETARLWDVATGQQLRSFKTRDYDGNLYLGAEGTHDYNARAVAFSPNGKLLASGSGNETIIIWNVDTGKQLRSLDGYASSVAFSPDGKWLTSSGGDDKTITMWAAATGQKVLSFVGHTSFINAITFSPDGKILASGSNDKTVRLWDAATGQQLRLFSGHANFVNAVAFSPDGKLLASGSSDNTVKLWDKRQDKELISLLSLDKTDWAIVTPDGLFDGSPAAWNKMIWRAAQNTVDFAPVEAYFSDFYYPGLLADIFANKRPRAPSDISQKDRHQPQLTLTLVAGQPPVAFTTRNVSVKINIPQAPAGAQDVRLFRNGSLVKMWHGDVVKGQSTVTLAASVPLVAGANQLTAYAFNHDNIKSSDATLVLNGAESLRRKGTAYVVAVGVNEYAPNPFFRKLKYAVADAEEFATEVKRQQAQLALYEQVEVLKLTDAVAAKVNILGTLAELAKKAQPEDVVIVYFAGHGLAEGGRFYLIPQDIETEMKPADQQSALNALLVAHGISAAELEDAFEGVDAGQVTMIIDACNSGQALGGEREGRGPMNSKGLAQLAYDKGMYILTAAQSFQFANELPRLGHGYLTYALIEEGLRQDAADDKPKDGTILVREWFDYTTERVPIIYREEKAKLSEDKLSRLRGLNLGAVSDTIDEVQQPRVFYRRELEIHPLIVAKTKAAQP